MSYDVYWVKNRAEKIADFEHPTPQPSRINFYFVTSFYSLYDICMVAQVHRHVGCDDATCEVSAATWQMIQTSDSSDKMSLQFYLKNHL